MNTVGRRNSCVIPVVCEPLGSCADCVKVVDEEDHLEELVSKLRRRRRQAAGSEEISAIEDEQLHVRARLTALRSSKLGELKGEADAQGDVQMVFWPRLLPGIPDYLTLFRGRP